MAIRPLSFIGDRDPPTRSAQYMRADRSRRLGEVELAFVDRITRGGHDERDFHG